MTIEDTRQLLLRLAEAICQVIQTGLDKEILKPEYERCFRWKLTDFKYDETGISKKSAEGQELLKPYWYTAKRKGRS